MQLGQTCQRLDLLGLAQGQLALDHAQVLELRTAPNLSDTRRGEAAAPAETQVPQRGQRQRLSSSSVSSAMNARRHSSIETVPPAEVRGSGSERNMNGSNFVLTKPHSQQRTWATRARGGVGGLVALNCAE